MGFMILPTSYLISYSDHSTIPYLTGFRSGFWLRHTKKLTDPYYVTRNRLPPVASPNFQPPKHQRLRSLVFGNALGLMAVYTRPAESHLLCGKIPVVALGDILPRVAIVAVPSGLST